MITLVIEELKQSIKLISGVKCDSLSEYCIVALEAQEHKTGCQLTVTGDVSRTFGLSWSKVVNKSAYKERTEYTNHGAEAIAFFLSSNLTPYRVFEQASIGTGIDWWLCYAEDDPNYDPDNFMNARLEVSGLSVESPSNSLKRRVREKKEQTKPTDNRKLPAYISVTAFPSLKAYFGKK